MRILEKDVARIDGEKEARFFVERVGKGPLSYPARGRLMLVRLRGYYSVP